MASAAIVSMAPSFAGEVEASENTAPIVYEDDLLVQGKSAQTVIDAKNHFTDVENPNDLVFTVSGYDENAINVTVNGSEILVKGLGFEAQTILTITATDLQGSSISKEITVITYDNEPTLDIPDVTIESITEPHAIDLSKHFVDADGDSFSVVQIDKIAINGITGVADAYVEGNQLIVQPHWEGTIKFDVMVSSGFWTISDEFTVNVVKPQNTAPYLWDDNNLTWNTTTTVPLEVDGRLFITDIETPGNLTYTVSGVDESLIRATVNGTKLNVEAVGTGQTSFTLTATDSEGLSASKTITVNSINENTNTAPTVIEGENLEWEAGMGATSSTNGKFYFTDTENPNELVYTASNYDDSLIKVTINGDNIRVDSLGKGTTPLTITAEDPQGATVSQTFNVKASNLGVELVNPIPDVTIELVKPFVNFQSEDDINALFENAENIVTIDLSQYFVDPEGDEVKLVHFREEGSSGTFHKIEGMKVTFAPYWTGSATFTASVYSPSGGYVIDDTFTVNVVKASNTTPFTTSPNYTIPISNTNPYEVDTRWFFDDLETLAAELTYTVSGVDESLINVTVDGTKLNVVAVGTGLTTFELIATDPQGLSNSKIMTFNSVIENTAPTINNVISNTEIDMNSNFGVADLGYYFKDAEAQNDLVYTVSEYDSSLVDITIEGSRLDYKALKAGKTNVTITAADPEGKSVSQTFTLFVGAEVQNVQATVINDNDVKLTWDSYNDSTRYRIQTYVKDSNGDFVKDGFARTVSGTSYTFTTLDKEKEYNFEVIPYTNIYESESAGVSNNVVLTSAAEEVVEETVEGTEETSVATLHVGIEGTTANLSWDALTDVTRYRVEKYVKDDSGNFVKEGTASAIAKTTHTYTGLEEGKEYKFVVTPRIGWIYDKEQVIEATASIEGSSEPTEQVVPTPEPTDNGEVEESTNLLNAKVVQNGDKATVTWGHISVNGTETSRYRVQQYVKNASGVFEKDGFARTVKGDSYTFSIKFGKEYQYEIIPQVKYTYDYDYSVKVTL